MKMSRFSESQIISLLNRHKQGQKVHDICREHGISDATFYNWKTKYGGLNVSELARMKELEIENARLKRMYADLSLVHYALKDAVEKKAIILRQGCRAVNFPPQQLQLSTETQR